MTALETTTVVVLVERGSDGAIRDPFFEVVAAARGLADDVRLVAAWLGDDEPTDLDRLASYGVHVVHQVRGDGDAHLTATGAELLGHVARTHEADVVLAVSTFFTKELMARLAIDLHGGLIVDAAGFSTDNGRILVDKTVLAGTWQTRSCVVSDVQLITVKPHSFTPEPASEPAELVVRVSDIPISPAASRVRLISRSPIQATGRPRLSEATRIVCAGRGAGPDLSDVEALADALDAAVGATRDIVDEGWIGHEAQIGQTGVTVAPELYLGIGVSGAVHHRGGMQASGTIVAINADPGAPLVKMADLAIIGDARRIVPELTRQVQMITGKTAGDDE